MDSILYNVLIMNFGIDYVLVYLNLVSIIIK